VVNPDVADSDDDARGAKPASALLHVVLLEPRIPPNTGNAIRLCANTGAHLHLVEPLGFDVDDAQLRRAGLDYHEYATMRVHASLDAALAAIAATNAGAADGVGAAGAGTPPRVFALSARGRIRFDTVRYRPGDVLLFGSETTGLPDTVLTSLPESQRLCLPMRPGNRSLNLSNAIAVTVYEAWRQFGYPGAAT
jgi:tRNA (cytidine/uridine-2'-O-)-methyltransferase